MRASVALSGSLAALSILAACGRPDPHEAQQPAEKEIPVRALEQSGEQQALSCTAEFVDSDHKKAEQHKNGKIVWLLTGACPQARLVPVKFVLKGDAREGDQTDEELCQSGTPVDDEFVVTAGEGRRVTAELTKEVQNKYKVGTRRRYCYTLLLKAPNQADVPIDPEIEYIWP
jgi:hypothetical protein